MADSIVTSKELLSKPAEGGESDLFPERSPAMAEPSKMRTPRSSGTRRSSRARHPG
jgi:hypothetical protein